MSAKEMQQNEVITTTHYWGYRELDASEIAHVGGAYDGDYADSGACDSGYDMDAGYQSAAYGAYSDETGSKADKAACIAYCTDVSLPTPDFGMSFFRCMNDCYSPFSGGMM